jgi:CspA family cold shock protein
MPTATLKWFSPQKRSGFIAADGGGPDVFVHVSAVERTGLGGLNEGQKIQFDLVTDPRRGKPSAENLKAI